ncbi:MAG: ATP-binding cassette domain-containing protein [Actinobacteria bacterium]|nr:ATP-binding cassette domain-containing protein [Actinomycetota bacterium]
MKNDKYIIEVFELKRKFKEIIAVDGISLDITSGEIFGFLGPNGAGKTTTIQMLCTLLRPTSGTARLNGYDIIKDKDKVRKSIGLVFQDPSVDVKLTAWENLEFHRLIYDVPRVQAIERMKEVVEMVGLSDRIKDRVETYSGGMRRRLEIARGLIHHPKIMFLDEPTIGLDPQTRNRIWSYIHGLKSSEEITIFMTTHYMDEAENCDRIAIIDAGKIIALDTPDNLKKKIGGDIISINTQDNTASKMILEQKFGFKVMEQNSTLMFEVKDGDKFLPKLFKETALSISSVTVRRPTLEDVFLALTGRTIREEGPSTRMRLRMH